MIGRWVRVPYGRPFTIWRYDPDPLLAYNWWPDPFGYWEFDLSEEDLL